MTVKSPMVPQCAQAIPLSTARMASRWREEARAALLRRGDSGRAAGKVCPGVVGTDSVESVRKVCAPSGWSMRARSMLRVMTLASSSCRRLAPMVFSPSPMTSCQNAALPSKPVNASPLGDKKARHLIAVSSTLVVGTHPLPFCVTMPAMSAICASRSLTSASSRAISTSWRAHFSRSAATSSARARVRGGCGARCGAVQGIAVMSGPRSSASPGRPARQ